MSRTGLRRLVVATVVCVALPIQADDKPVDPVPKPLELTAGWGSIEGQFVLEGDAPVLQPLVKNPPGGGPNVPNERLVVDAKSKGIANVIVYLKKAPAGIHPDLKQSRTAIVDVVVNRFQFVPHVLTVRTDQSVRCTSADGNGYNVVGSSFVNKPFNAMIVGARVPESSIIQLPRPEKLPVNVQDDIHPWMQGYWVVTDHPYAAVTDSGGRFKIEGLPVGEHHFTVWHEAVGYIDREWIVAVPDKETLTVPLKKVPVGVFKRLE